MKRLSLCQESVLAMPRKHLTQRVVVPQPSGLADFVVNGERSDALPNIWYWRNRSYTGDEALRAALVDRAPFHVGDSVALTETWRIAGQSALVPGGAICIQYKADGFVGPWLPKIDRYAAAFAAYLRDPKAWHSPYFMFPEFSRFHVTITSVTAHRVQDMTCGGYMFESDVQKEGCPFETDYETFGVKEMEWYSALWDRLNGKRYPWASNPWVYGIGWKKTEVAAPEPHEGPGEPPQS